MIRGITVIVARGSMSAGYTGAIVRRYDEDGGHDHTIRECAHHHRNIETAKRCATGYARGHGIVVAGRLEQRIWARSRKPSDVQH